MTEFSYRNIKSDIIGADHGLNIEEEFDKYSEQIKQIILNLNSNKDKPGQWLQWMNSAYNEETLWYIKEYAAMINERFDNLLVLGIGGSSLAGKALCESLLPPFWNSRTKEERKNFPKVFFMENVDPDRISALLDILDLKKTLVNVITKSGQTAETMAQFMIIKDRLEKELGDDYRMNVAVTTDNQRGILRQLANQEGYKTFEFPDDVGGRFSVFSPVGLLPAAIAGLNIDEIIKGVKDMDVILKNTDIRQNIAAQNALIHYLLDTRHGKNISVMMPYSSRLKLFADWYVHLWSESLGKAYDREGNRINSGQTPMKATGCSDQHTQLQLFTEGPNNKVITFVRVKEFDTVLQIPTIFEYTGINYLCGKTVNDLINAESHATETTLTDYSRPNVCITIPKINEYCLAQLLYMLQIQTAITGELYNIDPFSQPGTDLSKDYTYALMGRTGYEDSAERLKERMTF